MNDIASTHTRDTAAFGGLDHFLRRQLLGRHPPQLPHFGLEGHAAYFVKVGHFCSPPGCSEARQAFC